MDCDESDRSRLVLYVCSNGLRQLRVDRIAMHHVFWILEACTELHALRLDVLNCEDNLGDYEVAQLIENMQNLRYLHLIGPGLTDTGLLKLLENCEKLQKLYLYDFQDSNADDPDDSYSEVAVNASPPLTVLHVHTITTPTLADVLYTYPKLTNLGIGLSTVESFASALQVLHNYNITELHLRVPQQDLTWYKATSSGGVTNLPFSVCGDQLMRNNSAAIGTPAMAKASALVPLLMSKA
eukprot:gene9687-11390_t